MGFLRFSLKKTKPVPFHKKTKKAILLKTQKHQVGYFFQKKTFFFSTLMGSITYYKGCK